MPKYSGKKVEQFEVVSEQVITEREACEMLGVRREDVYLRVIHEITTNAAPWAVIRLQAVKRK